MPFLFSLLVIALMIGALVDIVRRDDTQVKHLPKLAWIVVVILLPLIGAGLWFALGREYGESSLRMPRMRRQPRPAPPVDVRPVAPLDLRTTEQQIADLDREIEEWRSREESAKRKGDDDGSSAGATS